MPCSRHQIDRVRFGDSWLLATDIESCKVNINSDGFAKVVSENLSLRSKAPTVSSFFFSHPPTTCFWMSFGGSLGLQVEAAALLVHELVERWEPGLSRPESRPESRQPQPAREPARE